MDSAPDALVVSDDRGRITHVSRMVTALFGWPADELVGRPVEALVPPDLHHAHREHRAHARLGEGPRVMHGGVGVDVVTRDGRLVPVEVTLSAFDDDGRRVFVASLRDVSRTRTLQRQVAASRDSLLEVLDGAREQAILVLDERGHVGAVFSAGAERLLGTPAAEARGRAFGDFFDAAEVAERGRTLGLVDATDVVLARARDRGHDTAAWTWHRPDGASARVSVSLTGRRDGRGFIVVASDVQEASDARAALTASQARFSAAFDHAPVPMAVVSLRDTDTGQFVHVNRALCALLGRAPADLLGHHFNEFTHPDDLQIGRDLVRLLRRGQVEQWEIEKRYVRPDGSVVWVRVNAQVAPQADGGRPEQVVVLMEDVGHRREVEADLAHRALHDALTGLPNVQLLHEHLAGAMARARRTSIPVGVLLVDVDDFKLVNDSLGTAAGDAVLATIAERLRTALRDVDFVARSGGDEFVVVAENLPDDGSIEHLADRVLAAVHEPVHLGDHTVTPTASVGIAIASSGDVSDVIADAEGAMYGAKATGKSRWSQADRSRRDHALRQITVEHELRAALASDQLYLVYQPVYDLVTLRPIAVEALVRWRHPRRGVVGPDQFLDVAEARDLIRPLGTWVLRTACGQAAAWVAEFGEAAPQMWVNVSARQLGSAQLHREVRRALADAGLPGHRLHVELTERQLVDLGPSVRSDLHRMRELGVGLAIDDWGTGHNGIEHLRHLPATALKIDRSFTAGLGQDRTDTALTVSIVALGRELGLTVVAEGIETAEQLATLQQLGAPLGQGYHFSRPLDVDAAARLLHDPALAVPPAQTPVE